MERQRKTVKGLLKTSTCTVCKKRFRTRSHFDALCNLCWADNEMRPYLNFGNVRGSSCVN